MASTPTYAFRGDKTYAIRDSKVIASGTDPDEVEQIVEAEEREEELRPQAKRSSTHVVTPNGLRGEILGKHTIWGGELTVRYANGTITEVAAEGVKPAEEEPESRTATAADPIGELESRLASEVTPVGRNEVVARLEELDGIERELEHLNPRGARRGAAETARLQGIFAGVRAERQILRQSLDLVEEAEAADLAPAPYSIQVAPAQPALGDWDGAGIEEAHRQLRDEAAQTDYDAVLREEPALVVEDLPNAVVDEPDLVRERALAHVKARTAGVESNALSTYHETFAQRAELARRARVAKRQPAPETRTASVDTSVDDLPDEVFFL